MSTCSSGPVRAAPHAALRPTAAVEHTTDVTLDLTPPARLLGRRCAGTDCTLFDIGDLRFGITICYDSLFPELALVHSLNKTDLVLCPNAARSGEWPAEPDPAFCAKVIAHRQNNWEVLHRARASDHNCYVL